MKLSVLLVTVATLATLVAGQLGHQLTQEDINERFENFKTQYSRVYHTAEEEAKRKDIFAENLRFIITSWEQYLRGHRHYSVSVNNFTDYTDEEFVRLFLSRPIRADAPRSPAIAVHHTPANGILADGAQWDEGVLTPVKNQGQLGVGWAFAATTALEAAHTLHTAWFRMTPLSVENVIQCARNETVEGAFEYILANGGLDSAQSYPYTGHRDQCHYQANAKAATISGYVLVDQNELALADAVASLGPVAATIDATQKSFRFYSSGVYDDVACSGEMLTHGITVTGFDYDIWYLRNSFGTDWGEEGNMRMTRSRGNLCGIYSRASYPLVE